MKHYYPLGFVIVSALFLLLADIQLLSPRISSLFFLFIAIALVFSLLKRKRHV